MRMLTMIALGLCTLAAGCQTPADRMDRDEAAVEAETSAAEETGMPDGWNVRFDREGSNAEEATFVRTDGGFRATHGPAAIYYSPQRFALGDYTAAATFTQREATPHPEAYGLFIGGQNLDGEDQEYLYFLVRQTGEFLVKLRDGDGTETLVPWTAREAVRPVGEPNRLAIDVEGDGIVFHVNDAEVTRLDRADLRTDGLVGFRVNHRLDVQIDDFTIEPVERGA